MSYSRLLINRFPLWRGQTRKGVQYGPAILESITREIVNTRYPMISNFINAKYLNNSNDHRSSTVGISDYFLKNLSFREPGKLILNLGGDHGIAMGTIPPMLVKYPNLKVIWIDAHADINSPKTSMTGNFHGMPLYFISELCDGKHKYGTFGDKLFPNKLLLKNLTYVGVRDMDAAEEEVLKKNNIRNYMQIEIANRGIRAVVEEIIDKNNLNSNPVHISFDVDSIDPKYCPSTGTRSDNGLRVADVAELCRRIKQTGNLVSFDLVEFNPLIGDENDVERTVSSIEEILESVLIESTPFIK